MNRIEMAKHISERVPILALRDESKWKEAERLRRQFVTDYPVTKIGRLSLDEYVIGKGSASRSFCYRLERETDILGRILGARADKFGIYYGKTKSDAKLKYRFARHWGGSASVAFKSVKQSIVDLLHATSIEDMKAIRENKISPMFKGKLLFIYHPAKFSPIYAKPHLEHFLAQLDISGIFETETDMQRALMDYRARWPKLRKHHPCLYMRFLYDLFGYPEYGASSSAGTASSISAPMLSDAVKGVTFIDKMPAISGTMAPPDRATGGSVEYAKQQKQLKRIGDRGEAIVIEIEKQRLINAGRKDLATKIKYIAERDDRAGFDVLSFDEDGTERQIEVKATIAKALEKGFYITANELEQASKLENYHIYFVFSAMSKRPQILPVKRPKLSGGNFDMKAIAYHVSLKASVVNADN